MKRTLFSRLFLSHTIIVIFFSIVLFFLSSQFFSQYYFSLKEKEMIQTGQSISEFISSSPENFASPSQILELIHQLSPNFQVLLINQERSSNYFNHFLPPPRGDFFRNFMQRRGVASFEETLAKVWQGETISWRGVNSRLNQTVLTVAIPVTQNGEISSALLLFTPIADVEATTEAVEHLIFLASLVSLSFSLLLAYFLSGSIVHPIRKLREAAQDLTRGNLQKKIKLPKRKDELGQLAEDFNHLSSALEKTIENLHYEIKQKENILLNMSEGVVALNQQGEIILINPALANILKVEIKQIVGTSINRLFPQPEIQNLFWEVLNQGKPTSREYKLEESKLYLLIHVTPLLEEKDIQGAVGVFQDITELQQLDELRREFLANASHELRTPLTSIQGFVEAIIDGVITDEELKHKYLQVIHRETLRLSRLIHDLLDLSLLESEKSNWEMSPLDMPYLVNQVLLKLTPQIEEQAIVIKKNFTANLPLAWGNADRIEQVLINLLNNAITFSPKKSEVEIEIEGTEKEIVISIKDEGPGIPPEEFPYIFERFHRVEKSRSRKSGGVGLGLAIAKQIVEKHGGEITAQNRTPRGASFTFTLPLAHI